MEATETIATVHPPLPLLIQARRALAEAQTQERHVRREAATPGSGVTFAQVTAVQQQSRKVQGGVDQVERSAAALPTALAEARRMRLMEESAYASLGETNRKAAARQAHRVRQAREMVERLEADGMTIAGADAVREGGDDA
jgi:hypothetical protein